MNKISKPYICCEWLGEVTERLWALALPELLPENDVVAAGGGINPLSTRLKLSILVHKVLLLPLRSYGLSQQKPAQMYSWSEIIAYIFSLIWKNDDASLVYFIVVRICNDNSFLPIYIILTGRVRSRTGSGILIRRNRSKNHRRIFILHSPSSSSSGTRWNCVGPTSWHLNWSAWRQTLHGVRVWYPRRVSRGTLLMSWNLLICIMSAKWCNVIFYCLKMIIIKFWTSIHN